MSKDEEMHLPVLAELHQTLNEVCEMAKIDTPALDDGFVDDVLFAHDRTGGQ